MLKIDEDMEYSRSNRSSGSSSPDLMSEDMRKERERQQWEEEAYVKPALKEYYDEEVDDQVKKNVQVHYQTVKHKGEMAVVSLPLGHVLIMCVHAKQVMFNTKCTLYVHFNV